MRLVGNLVAQDVADDAIVVASDASEENVSGVGTGVEEGDAGTEDVHIEIVGALVDEDVGVNAVVEEADGGVDVDVHHQEDAGVVGGNVVAGGVIAGVISVVEVEPENAIGGVVGVA